MVTPTVTELRRHGDAVGNPVEPPHRAFPAARKPMWGGKRLDRASCGTHSPAGPTETPIGHVGD